MSIKDLTGLQILKQIFHGGSRIIVDGEECYIEVDMLVFIDHRSEAKFKPDFGTIPESAEGVEWDEDTIFEFRIEGTIIRPNGLGTRFNVGKIRVNDDSKEKT